jgi:hypothetical protein
MWWYDAVPDTWTRITNVPPALLGVHSLAYDPANRVMLFAKDEPNHTLSLWTLDEAGSWARVSTTLPVVFTIGSRWDTLEYDPVNRLFWFLNVRSAGEGGTGGVGTNDVELWVYRYRRSTPPSDPPASPGNLRVS